MDKYFRMSRERFEQLNQEQKASGLSINDFCKHQGFSKTSFYFWRQKFNMAERPTDNDPKPAPLTPINITEGGEVASMLPRQARPKDTGRDHSKETVPCLHEDSIAIDLPGGVSIRFNGKAQQKAVKIVSAIISAYVLP
jgi:putative transposase